MKRTYLSTRVIVAVACLASVMASRAEEFEYEGLRYNTLTDTTAEVVSYNQETTGDIVVPDSVSYSGRWLKVTAIGRYAFSSWWNPSITSVSLPRQLTRIEENAFSGQKQMATIDIPESVEHIGPYAFYNTGLKRIALKRADISLEDGVFSGCESLTEAQLPEGMKTLPGFTFNSCVSLVNISLPSSLEEIGSACFSGCYALGRLVLPEGLRKLESSVFANCKTLREVVWNEQIEEIGDNLFSYCESLEEVVLPATLKKIPYACFDHCTGLRRITIPSSVTVMEYQAFEGCSRLEQVTMEGSTIDNIPAYAFKGCSSLKAFQIPPTVKTIANNAFEASGLESIVLGQRIERISSEAFIGCIDLADVYLRASGIEDLGEWTEYFCAATRYFGTLHVPEGLTNDFRYRTGWNKFVNIVEENTSGQTYCMVDVRPRQYCEFYVNDALVTEAHTELVKGDRLTIGAQPREDWSTTGYYRYLVGITVNGQDRMADVTDGQLTIEAVEEDMDIVVDIRQYNHATAIYQDERGGVVLLNDTHDGDEVSVLPESGYTGTVTVGPWRETYRWENPWYETYDIDEKKTLSIYGWASDDTEMTIKYQKK